MTGKSILVANGFLKLTDEEKKEVVTEIQKYYNANPTEKRSLENSIERTAGVVLGPTHGTCPCCGR